jgi:L-fucose mutarotase/ribose pyranase (RbsD/FucU family)
MKKLSVILIALMFINGCTNPVSENKTKNESSWKTEFNKTLPLLGHRNWILVVDKAFPLQTSQGLTIISTGEKLAPVLKYVLDQIDLSTHVQPGVYHDAELNFLTTDQVPGKDKFLSSVNQVLGNLIPVPILHDSVFVKIDAASKLFRVVVLKTEETIPYTSVFIELGCKYWSGDNEKELRKRMEAK